jgi:protein-disulfide isomerase
MNSITLRIIFFVLVAVDIPSLAAAEKRTAKQAMTREQADAMLDELRSIRELIASFAKSNLERSFEQREPANIAKRIKLDDLPILGSRNARVTIAEFFDYQCPFCRDFHVSTLDAIRKTYIDTGRVRFVSVDLPLAMHSNAAKAAEVAHCGGDQGKFWDVRDRLSRNPEKLGPTEMLSLVRDLPIDFNAFQSCLDSGKYTSKVASQGQRAASVNITGTPAFVVGKSTYDEVEGTVIVGAQPFAAFEAAIQAAETQK